MTLGEQIKYWRNKRGLTQTELAEKLNLKSGKVIISFFEKGVRNPSIGLLNEICDALDCKLEILLSTKIDE